MKLCHHACSADLSLGLMENAVVPISDRPLLVAASVSKETVTDSRRSQKQHVEFMAVPNFILEQHTFNFKGTTTYIVNLKYT